MAWYDGLSDEQIRSLQLNNKPMGLCWVWQSDCLREMPDSDREWFSATGWVKDRCWLSEVSIPPHYNQTYRLRLDWQRPEKEEGGEMNWYDGLTDEQIEELKNNRIGGGLEPEWMPEVFRRVTDRSLEWWDSNEATWRPTNSYDTGHTYRLRLDWQRPDEMPSSPDDIAKAENKKWIDEFHELRREDRRWELFVKLLTASGNWEDVYDPTRILLWVDNALAAYYNDKEGAE
jgi:hypothetical protein